MKRNANVIPVVVLAGLAFYGYREYMTPARQLDRARATLKAMERQERRDANTHRRTAEDVERARFARPERFANGTRGKRLNHEAASDKMEDVQDWYADRRDALEQQRELVHRLEREAEGGGH